MAANPNWRTIAVADFDDIRGWEILPRDQQTLPLAYRQPKYLPDLVDGDHAMARFEQAIRTKDPNTGMPSLTFAWPLIISRALGRLTYLETISDLRHVELSPNQRPTPKNLTIGSLPHALMHRHISNILEDMFAEGQYQIVTEREWLRWPFYWIAMDNCQYMRFATDMDAIAKLELVQRHRLRKQVGGMRIGFKWARNFRRSLEDAHKAVFAAWMWSRHEHVTPEDAFSRCLEDIPEMTRLLALLLEREGSVERLQAQEHIFGCQFDKRIQLLSSNDLNDLWAGFAINGDHGNFNRALGIYHDLFGLYRQLSDQALRLNQLFDYKYLWAWNAIRMWNRMYVIIRPDMRIFKDTIHKFRDWTQRYGEVPADIFGVHPVTEEEITGNNCIVCLEDFVDNPHPMGTVVVELKCGHMFHPKCVQDHWDQPNFWWNRCPTCRQSALRLRDIDIINPQQADAEYEVPSNLQTENHLRNQVEAVIEARNDPSHFHLEALNAYWRRRIRENVTKPMFDERNADIDSWASVIGGT